MKTTLKKKLKRPVEVIVYVLQTFLYKNKKKKSQESHSSKYMNALAK